MPEDQQDLHFPEYLAQDVFRDIVITPILINSCHLFLYGLYIFIFRVAISALKERPHSPERRFHVISLNTLFILATVNVPFRLAVDIFFCKLVFWKWEGLGFLEYVLTVVPGYHKDRSICDLSVSWVFRFFVIWGYRKIYVVIPMMAFVLVDVVGVLCAAISASQASLTATIIADTAVGINAFLNIVLTVLIAVRIWRETHRNADLIGGLWSTKKINTIIAVVLESGILYAIVVIAFIVCNSLPKGPVLNGIVVQVAGIAPTLIVARANSHRRRADNDKSLDEIVVGQRDVDVTTLNQQQVLTCTQSEQFVSLTKG
ncbi:hypothetical protein L218DRAFT_1006651 [Marasmius fiardii PR-910]|nr:hypothetical protein L218DRAFT_1006651 [Marasmius fiardii PR-910]